MRPLRAAPPEAFPVATEIRIGGDDSQTRFVIDLTRKVDLRAFTLADPYRVVIDLSQITFALPPKSGDSGRGLVKAYRYGLVMAGGSRIVIDVVKARARRQDHDARCRRGRSGADRARSGGGRPRDLHAHARARQQGAHRHGEKRRARAPHRRPRPIRVR